MEDQYVIDSKGTLWEYYEALDCYYRVANKNHNGYKLKSLDDEFGPVHKVTRGARVEPPFKPVSEGTWVEFDRTVLPNTVSGRVRHYDDGKLFYEISINVPRSVVKESL